MCMDWSVINVASTKVYIFGNNPQKYQILAPTKNSHVKIRAYNCYIPGYFVRDYHNVYTLLLYNFVVKIESLDITLS